jgi:chemotaxis family two-component system sensor kinase Cph1
MMPQVPAEASHLRRGQHACLFYETAPEQRAVSIPFVRQAMEEGDCCLYVADDRQPQDVADDFQVAGVQLEEKAQHGAIQILTKYETFLRYARFEPILMFEFLERTARMAARHGFAGVRVAAEMSWALSAGCEQLIEFEALCNQYLKSWNITMLCQYNLNRFAPQILRDALRAHPCLQVEQRICDNVFFEPKDILLAPGTDLRRIQWMLATIRRLNRAPMPVDR